MAERTPDLRAIMTAAFEQGVPWTEEEEGIVLSYLAGLGVGEKVDRHALLAQLKARGYHHRTYKSLACKVQRMRRRIAKGTAPAPATSGGEQPAQVVAEKPKESVKVDGKGDATFVETNSPDIRTLEDALRAANVDQDTWEVDRFLVNWWDVTISAKKANADRPEMYTNFQVKVWLRRRVPELHQVIVEGLCAAMRGKAPKVPRPRVTGEHVAVLGLYDAHFGKLAWGKETGVAYDLTIARDTYLLAVNGLLDRIRGMGVGRIIIPVGQDLLHVDSAANTTEKGTPQDVDGRLPKIYTTACETVARAVTLCAHVAPVEALYVPGNHDRNTSFYLCEWLRAWFHGQGHAVQVDTSPMDRKYRRAGATLLGFTHGSEEPLRDLPVVMAKEAPDEWAAATYHQWLVGHLHGKRQMHYAAGDVYGGVEVKVLPPLCRTDRWHYQKGYVKGRRAAEVHLYHEQDGPVGFFATNLPE